MDPKAKGRPGPYSRQHGGEESQVDVAQQEARKTNPYYASPEVWKDLPYNLKSDIWSFGCVIYEMCTLHPPFRADDMAGLFKRVCKGNYP